MPRMHSQLISFARSNNEKGITCQECQSAMVVYGQTIIAKVSHQNWCKVSQQKPWSCVVRQSPQKFHTRAGAKFHSKSHGRMWSDNHRKSFTPELVQNFTEKAMVVCRQTITAKVSHQNWCKVSQQKPWRCVVRQSPQKFHTRTGAKSHSKSHGRVSSDNHRKSFTPELVQSFTAKAMVVCGQTITAKVSHQSWCKISQKKPWSCVVRQSPQKFHTRTGAKSHSKSHGRVSSDNHRKSFTPELVQSFTAKAMVVCGQTITAKVSHQSWCKISQKKPWSCVVRQSPQKFHTRTGAKSHSKSHGRVSSDNHRKSFTPELVQSLTAKAMVVCRQTITAKVSHQSWCKVSQQKPWSYVVRQSPQKFHTRAGAKFHRKSHGRVSSDNHRKSFTPELVRSLTAKAMVVCRQTITAKVSHQNWCEVSQQKPWSCVVRQSPQKFHTRAGAKFHSKSHGRMWSDNHRKSFTPELVQNFTEKAMVVCRQTITAKVSHQNWCEVSQQKPWSCVVRQSPQKFHTRTGAKSHSKSHGRVSSDNHRKSFTPELVQSFTAKAMVVCGQTITAKVSHQSWCKISQKKPWSCVVRQSPQKFHTRTGAKSHSKSHGGVSSDNHRKSFTPELVRSLTAKAMVVCRQTITAKVSHQSWCKVSQQKPWSYVVRQSPQKFHTRAGAKFHRKSHGRVSSDNHRKSFTTELVQSFTAKAMVVCGQKITAKVFAFAVKLCTSSGVKLLR